MDTYDLMIKANHYLIKGGMLTDRHKNKMVNELLVSRSMSDEAQGYCGGVGFPSSTDKQRRGMYPIFYIPPHNSGKGLKTILGQTPKTQILSANMYELEILRLLYILAPKNEEVSNMVSATLGRLKTTCFGYMDDGAGECFDASLVVLRFLAAAAVNETEWIGSRIDNFKRHYNEKKRPWFPLWYYWLCLSELPFEIAVTELDSYKSEMLNRLESKGCVMNNKNDSSIRPVLQCILRNALSKYPEYEYLGDSIIRPMVV